MSPLTKKRLVVFDLDGTLAPSKAPLRPDMQRALAALLAQKKVAVIGGGTYALFRMQLADHLHCGPDLLANLFLFPTTSTSFYRHRNGAWKKVYEHKLSAAQKKKIRAAFSDIFKEVGYVHPRKTWGKVLDDRGTQMTFSALGQDIVARLGEKKGIALKEKWMKENQPLRLKMVKLLGPRLKGFEIRAGGLTSIDVTQKGIDKAYGIRQIKKMLHIPIKDMVFIGDALYPGGNDYAAKKSGVQTIAVKDPRDTVRVIKKILNEK